MAKLTLPPEEWVRSGHSACPGCAAALAVRLLLKGLGPRTVVSVPACCWTVIATPYPTTALGVAMLDNPIESTGASISGLRAAADALGMKDVTIVGIAGDGGTADIGLQALSGMLERGTDAIYVMYDNEAYMNTGIQRSGATPWRAWTTTTPIGATSRGKAEPKKDIMRIVLAHHPEYAATVNPSFPEDFVAKVEKAQDLRGPRFLHALTPCPPGWKYGSAETIAVGRLATETGLFPLYEVERGRLRVTRRYGRLKPVREYLDLQGRFAHLTDDEIAQIQAGVSAEWEDLLRREATGPESRSVPAAPPVPATPKVTVPAAAP
jgi:pyruvate/2-oxoacid:ferredoxin oxidoreductase beta subunit